MSIKDIFSFQKKDAPTDYSVSLYFPLEYDKKMRILRARSC